MLLQKSKIQLKFRTLDDYEKWEYVIEKGEIKDYPECMCQRIYKIEYRDYSVSITVSITVSIC